jgi:S-adenosylmethionine decarboxylase
MHSKANKSTPFGQHLMLEAYNCPEAILDDANVAYKILDELPTKIGMTKMTLPYVVHAEGNGHKDPGGWTGFVLIAESHISLHTFAKRGYVTVDVYSCKEFDIDSAVNYFKKAFQTDDVEYKVEIRGERYPEKNIS